MGDVDPLCVVFPYLWCSDISEAFCLKENPWNNFSTGSPGINNSTGVLSARWFTEAINTCHVSQRASNNVVPCAVLCLVRNWLCPVPLGHHALFLNSQT